VAGDLIGKKAKWRVNTAQGLLEVEDEVLSTWTCKDMTLAKMKNTNSVVNIEVLFF